MQPETWLRSWGDEFISYPAWEEAGAPAGFVWGVEWADAYPGPSLDASSSSAAKWVERLGRPVHEIRIETNAYLLRLVCHSLHVVQLAVGDPLTGEMQTLPLE